MAKIACKRTECVYNNGLLCGADSICLEKDGACGSFLSRSEAERREVEVRFAPFSIIEPVVLLVRSNVPKIAEEVRALGFVREKEPPTGLSFLGWNKINQSREFVWCRRTTFSALEGVVESLSSQGFTVNNLIREAEVKQWEEEKTYYDLGKSERLQRLQELVPPRQPKILCGGRWNGKIYGGAGKEFVYVGGEQRKLSFDQLSEIRQYLKKKKEYEQLSSVLLRTYAS